MVSSETILGSMLRDSLILTLFYRKAHTLLCKLLGVSIYSAVSLLFVEISMLDSNSCAYRAPQSHQESAGSTRQDHAPPHKVSHVCSMRV